MVREIEINHYYLSAKEYAEQTGLGYQDVLDQCRKGTFDCFETEGGQWRIKVFKNVNQSEFECLKRENIELKNTIKNALNIFNKAAY